MLLPLDRHYLFIDGGCLRAIVRNISEGVFGDGDILTPLYPAIGRKFQRAYYYDAIPGQEQNELPTDYERRINQEYLKFDNIQAVDTFHVSLGEIKGRGRNRRQKQVDVRLAVDVLINTFRNNMAEITLLIGDEDFIPLVESTIREGMPVTIWHPPQATEALLSTADRRRLFDFKGNVEFLTRNGVDPVFQIVSTGRGTPPREPTVRSGHQDHVEYKVDWKGGEVSVYRRVQSEWEFKTARVPDSDLPSALKMFEIVTGWQIPKLS